jgi:hypothetical protein
VSIAVCESESASAARHGWDEHDGIAGGERRDQSLNSLLTATFSCSRAA